MSSELSPRSAEALQNLGEHIEIGWWYWVKSVDRKDKTDHFMCLVYVGSNYVEFQSPYNRSRRVHFDKFDDECRREMNPDAVIRKEVEAAQGFVQEKLAEVKKITARLGVEPNLNPEATPADESSRALSILSGTDNVKAYKKALIKAKDEDLPKLFKEIEGAHEDLAIWMKARTIPLNAMVGGMKDCVEKIEDRVFNVSLYAGLTEEIEKISDGPPAKLGEKLRLFQRLLYMDEECLLGYRHGGMTFERIQQFDEWIAERENRDRIFPFPRCAVAFQVRRKEMHRESYGDIATAFVNIRLAQKDKYTFLYIRNGEQLYRLGCDLEFGDLIFPGKDELNLSEPMRARVWRGSGSIQQIITERHYQDLVKEHERKEREQEEWIKANPGKHTIHAPHGIFGDHFSENDYEPFNDSSVYFDDIKAEIERRVKQYNRIALIIQGLYDRSEVLHPHLPAKLWDGKNFADLIELVYDGSNLLYHGDPPDFQAYVAMCNASIKVGSVTIGQEDFWEEREAKRFNNAYRHYQHKNVSRHQPYGNPGPGYIATVQEWRPRSRKALYRWTREFQGWNDWKRQHGDPVPDAAWVPVDRLFNVSGYKPGDWKQFFQDPRTRADYLGWAVWLLTAEEFHAGNLDERGELKKKRTVRK